jgi:hypothetical protein
MTTYLIVKAGASERAIGILSGLSCRISWMRRRRKLSQQHAATHYSSITGYSLNIHGSNAPQEMRKFIVDVLMNKKLGRSVIFLT